MSGAFAFAMPLDPGETSRGHNFPRKRHGRCYPVLREKKIFANIVITIQDNVYDYDGKTMNFVDEESMGLCYELCEL